MPFEPIDIGNVKIKNRFVRSATYEKAADVDGFVTNDLIKIYDRLACNKVGLIITGIALVEISGASLHNMLAIHNDAYIDGLKRLTDTIHATDSKVFVQLFHAGGAGNPAIIGKIPSGPSAVLNPSSNIIVKELTHAEICKLTEDFASAARRSVYAGFDGIQLHGAHGYLINQFLSPLTNQRQDYWGGDEQRRFHFLEEIYTSIRKETGYGYPITIKLNVSDFIEGGLQIQDYIRIAKKIEALGFDAIELSGGMKGATKSPAHKNILTIQDEAYWLDYAKQFKSALQIPMILCGGIRSIFTINKILDGKYADMVSMSRPFIREPDLVSKFADGKQKADCISCNQCMQFETLDIVRCLQFKHS